MHCVWQVHQKGVNVQNINQILITVIEANRLAKADNPHFQRLALVLLDNVIELQLRRKAKSALLFDDTTWYSGVRKHDRKRRKKISRFHGELLDLAVEESWITTQDALLLSYAHSLRNHAYHKGLPKDETDQQLGISLLFRFVCKYFPKWRGSGLLMAIPSESAIPCELAVADSSGRAPMLFGFEEMLPDDIFGGTSGFHESEHWEQVLLKIVSYNYSRDVRPLIQKRIENLVNALRENIEFLTQYDDNDFNGVLAHRFAILTPVFRRNSRKGKELYDPRVALNIYLAVLEHEERLLDISDPTERANEFAQVVNSHGYEKDIISSIDFDKYDSLIRNVTSASESEGIATFLDVEEKLSSLSIAVEECAMDLDGYTQLMIDLARGK